MFCGGGIHCLEAIPGETTRLPSSDFTLTPSAPFESELLCFCRPDWVNVLCIEGSSICEQHVLLEAGPPLSLEMPCVMVFLGGCRSAFSMFFFALLFHWSIVADLAHDSFTHDLLIIR